MRVDDSRCLDSVELGGGELVDIVSIDEGFSSSASCLVRSSNCLMALRREGLSMAQSGDQNVEVSRLRELNLALALARLSRDIDDVDVNEGLDSSGGLNV